MNKIIETIKQTILSGEPLAYLENYPIKIVHEKTRVKDDAVLEILDEIEFFDQDGFSNATHTHQTIRFLQENAPDCIQSVSFGVSHKQTHNTYTFTEKFPHDRWKKIVNDEELQAVIEVSYFSNLDELSTIETKLRDIMRSRKEVPLLKKIGFIWIADVTEELDISKIMHHYFSENFTSIKTEEKTIFIGWNKQLQNINMRYFVYPPQ